MFNGRHEFIGCSVWSSPEWGMRGGVECSHENAGLREEHELRLFEVGVHAVGFDR